MNSLGLHGYHVKNSRVAGVWNIIECVSLYGSSEATGIEGTEFLLTESGDVDWKVKEGGQHLPLFECQIYELYTYQNLQCYVNRTLIRFIGYKGHIIEFRLDQPVMSEDLMLLTYDGWFMLQCEKLPTPKSEAYQPYSLLPALQDGFFTDCKIISKLKREFPCHSVVLEASLPSLNWSESPNPLEVLGSLDDDVIETLLYYLYSRALPSDLLLVTSRKCYKLTDHIPDLEDFRNDCLVYGRNTCFRNHFIAVVNTVHESLENFKNVFSSTLAPSPSQIIHNLKVGLKHLAIGVIKVLEACMECEKAGDILMLSGQRELMQYIRIHMPLLLSKLIEILKRIKNTLGSMTAHTRQELAGQLVPEIHCAFHTILCDVTTIWKSLEQIVQESMVSVEMMHGRDDMNLSTTLTHDLQLRELQKLRILQENLSSLTNSILFKKEQFEEIESNVRIRGVARMLELITDELQDLIQRLQEFLHAIDDLLDWSEFKFVFKGATSKIRRILEKLCSHPNIIDSLVQDICDTVNDSTFTESLVQLGLLSKPNKNRQNDSHQKEKDHNSAISKPKIFSKSNSKHQTNAGFASPGSPSSLVTPPNASCSPKTLSALTAAACTLTASDFACGSHFPLDNTAEELCDGFSEISLSDDLTSTETDEDVDHSASLPCLPMNYMEERNRRGKAEPPKVEDFSIEELPPHLVEEAKKLNLVKGVCSIPSGHESKLSASLLAYLESGRYVDMTFMVIPPDDEDGCSNSSCDSLSSEGVSKDCPKNNEEDNSTSVDNDTLSKLDAGMLGFSSSRHVRRVKKSLSLDRSYNLTCSRPFSVNSDDSVSQGETKNAHNRIRSSSFKQSLPLDASAVLQDSCSTANGSVEVDQITYTRRFSASSDNYDSSEAGEVDNVPKGSDDSAAFDSLTHPLGSFSHLESLRYPFESLSSHTFESLSHPFSELRSSSGEKKEAKVGVELKAHRVIIATRCEWFKRALLSGMREAIDRHIEVPGVSFPVFKLFLAFLYGGKVDLTNLQLDELVDLLVLVDHYGVDTLKTLTEQCLETKVDDDSALPLMTVAYHCNAPKLKDICLQHCALKTNYEMLNQLPTELRQQLVSTINSLKKWHRHGLEDGLIEFNYGTDSVCEGGWDSPTSLDPLIDDESSSLLTGLHDSEGSSEENFCLTSAKR